MKHIALVAFVLLGAAAMASADPLDGQRVARDAKWMVHVDFAAVKRTELARYVAERWLVHPDAQKSLRDAREAIGLDPIEDLVGLTFYGRSYRPEDGVVLIEATGNRDRLAAFLKQQPGYTTVGHREHTIHRWKEAEGQQGERSLAGAIYGDRLLVVGRSESLVREAIDVLDGMAPCLAGQEGSLSVQPPAGTSVMVVASDFEEVDAPFKSPILRQSRRIALAMGEAEGTAFLWGEVHARSEESAEQIRSVVEGMIAMLRMQFADYPDVLELLRPLAVTVSGERVTAQWRGPSREALSRMVEAVETLKSKP